MKHLNFKILIFIFFSIIFFKSENTNAQFYNGHQTTFGKNRLQYDRYMWSYRRYDKYDIYYYRNGYIQSVLVGELVKEKLEEFESFFGFSLRNRIIFLNFNSLSDFRQSNVGYETGNENSEIGASLKRIKNKIFIYNTGKYSDLKKQISGGLAEVMTYSLIYGGNYKQKLTNSTLINLPEWYISGLISYLSEDWNIEIEDDVLNALQAKKFKNINHLTGEDARIVGHAFWYYIGQTYNKSIIPNIIYLTRTGKNIDRALRYVIATDDGVKGLAKDVIEFYTKRLAKNEEITDEPSKETQIYRAKKRTIITDLKSSPDGEYTAWITNNMGKYKIYLYNNNTGKKKIIRRKGHKLDQITDFSYPVLAWHPSSKILSFITEEQGKTLMFSYNLEEKKLTNINLSYFEKVLSFSYSQNGYKIVFSGVVDGKSDLFVFDNLRRTQKNLTNDIADDLYPSFIDNSEKIIFSSNRTVDTTKAGNKSFSNQYDLFVYDYSKLSNKLTRVTETPLVNEIKAVELKKNEYICITDENGIYNRYKLYLDSTITSIDTVIHYSSFSTKKPITNSRQNIQEFSIDKNKSISDVVNYKNRYRIYKDELNDDIKVDLKPTQYRSEVLKKYELEQKKEKIRLKKEAEAQKKIDSIRLYPPKNLVHPDSVDVDVNKYVFETDKRSLYYKLYPINDSIFANDDTTSFTPTYNYFTNFYTNHMTQQIDFGYLHNSYQFFTGEEFYFNPGLNLFTKVGIFDLFEDYRLSAGFRMGTDLSSYEFLVSFEDLKNRADKEYIYHRQTFTKLHEDSIYYSYYEKIFTNELFYIYKYPLNQVSALKGTLTLRHDRDEILSTDFSTLAFPSHALLFAGAKVEYIFDNSLKLGSNLYDGTRFKLFAEYFQEVYFEGVREYVILPPERTNLFVSGFDFRFYKKLHRTLIFASRIAASASFGKSKLIYYLGGVDNWYNFSPDVSMFDNSVNINPEVSYVYQAVATNMRGFVQNARNGTNFFVWNNEIRFPIVRYLANRPLNSDFWNNLQIVGFADAGSAWSGLTPLDEANAYKTETIHNGPVTIIIDKNRWPVIFGYGFGLRSKLFGYFFRLDWAWGIDNDVILPRIFYFSLSYDF